MKVAIYTLGCKVNQYETQAMEQELRSRGHEVVEFSDEADAYVINSCSVTAVSDQKSRQVLHRVRRQHPQAVAALAGCYPQTHVEDVQKLDVDLIAGTSSHPEIFCHCHPEDFIASVLCPIGVPVSYFSILPTSWLTPSLW